MKKKKIGDLKLLQERNRKRMLNQIRTDGPISRVELAKKNKISPSTVAAAVEELIRDGYVTEIGPGASSGGRKPILLKFNPDHHFLFAVAVTNNEMILSTMNLAADALSREAFPIDGRSGDAIMEMLTEKLDNMVAAEADLSRCVGISVTFPGIVDHTGLVHYNTVLRMIRVPVRKMLEERYGLRVWVENDMNSIALAERRFGAYPYANMIYISIGIGLGSGVIIRDEILRGSRGGAGEFGHTSINRGGIRCECGNAGCLDGYISWRAVYSRIITGIASGRPTWINEMIGGDYAQIDPSVYKEALAKGDRLALDINEEIAETLAAALVNQISMFNPEAIVLGGVLAIGNPLLFQQVKEYIGRHAISILTEDMVLGVSSLKGDEKLTGAAAVLLQDVLGLLVDAD